MSEVVETTGTVTETSGAEATTNEATTVTDTATDKGQELSFAAQLKKASSKGATGEPVKETAVPAYQPNYKFKVKDKELEFEDWAKGVVKDKETEEKIRDFHAKAYGLDSVKQSREALIAEHTDLKTKYESTETALTQLGNFKASKDWDSFFDALDIPKQDILKYAVDLVQRDQWSPEQKAQWQQSREAMQSARHYQAENEQLLARQQQLSVQQRGFELDQALVQPEAAEIAQSYDTGSASPGAFRQFVIQIGQAYAARGEDISVADAVSEATKHLRAVMAQNAPAPQPVAQRIAMPNTKPIIPNIQGRGTSPIKSAPKSFADLQQRRRELEAQEGI